MVSSLYYYKCFHYKGFRYIPRVKGKLDNGILCKDNKKFAARLTDEGNFSSKYLVMQHLGPSPTASSTKWKYMRSEKLYIILSTYLREFEDLAAKYNT